MVGYWVGLRAVQRADLMDQLMAQRKCLGTHSVDLWAEEKHLEIHLVLLLALKMADLMDQTMAQWKCWGIHLVVMKA